MTRLRTFMILAIGSLAVNGAFAQTVTSASLRESNPQQIRPNTELSSDAIKRSGPLEPLRGGNPLWGVPASALTATRGRPLFAPTRRPPPPPVKAEALPPPPPPPPAEPEKPQLALVGTVTGDPQNIAVVRDQATNRLVRLHVGEAVSGWSLRSVDSRTMTVEKSSQTVTLSLPPPGSTQLGAPGTPPLPTIQQAFRMRRQF
jgi:type IV secretory pathway VirB10-like protein